MAGLRDYLTNAAVVPPDVVEEAGVEAGPPDSLGDLVVDDSTRDGLRLRRVGRDVIELVD